MGNSKSHLGKRFCSHFLPEEQAEIGRLFAVLSSQEGSTETSSGSFSLKALQGHVGEALPPGMLRRLYDGMRRLDLTGSTQGPRQSVSQEQFTASLWHLLRGSSEERSVVILKMISAAEGPVKARDVRTFAEDLVGAVVHVLTRRQELRGWAGEEAPAAPARTQALAAQLVSEMKLPGGERPQGPQWLDRDCDQAVIEDWVFRVPHVAMFLSVVVHRGLLLRLPLDLATLVPECQGEPGRELESLLDVLAVIFLNSHLAPELRQRWRLLFASRLHGQSFSQLCGRVTHRGPCLALLEDRGGHVFGGFASCSWEVKPQFQGDNKCFLFSIAPSMAVYTPTGYNDHYMYLNHGQQTIPNGLVRSRAWEGSTTTSDCGWMPTLGTGTARPSPRVPHTTARSCLPRSTSGLRSWRCGQLETSQSQSWPRVRRASSTWTLGLRFCWRPLGGLAKVQGSGKPQTATAPKSEQLDADAQEIERTAWPVVGAVQTGQDSGLGPSC